MLPPILADASPSGFNFKDTISTLNACFWFIYLPLEIWKGSKGKDKATVAQLDEVRLELAELAKEMKEERAERNRIQRGVDSEIGKLIANCNTLLEACKEQRASIEGVRKEFDAKLGSLHRRFDNVQAHQSHHQPPH